MADLSAKLIIPAMQPTLLYEHADQELTPFCVTVILFLCKNNADML